MIERQIAQKILEQKEKFPVIAITGPRQSGKTTLTKELFPDYTYLNLEDLNVKSLAENDPVGFINQIKGPVIIDEIQKVPKLLSQIQITVDAHKRMGEFVLTGSESLLLSEHISQSLAGRVANDILLPFSYAELRAHQEQATDTDEQILTGFYPRIYDTKMGFLDFYPEYLHTYVERDVRQMKNIGDLALFEKFLQLLAGRVGQLLNASSLANDVGVSHNTIEQWISLLEASYIIFRLRPYYKNFGKRVIKSPKVYFHDTGLLCYLLGIHSTKDLQLHFAYGHLFENLGIAELQKNIYNNKRTAQLYFFRDSNQVEIDVLIDNGSSLTGCEIKSAKTFNPSFLKNLNTLDKTVDTPLNSFLLYQGEQVQTVHDVQLINMEHLDNVWTQ